MSRRLTGENFVVALSIDCSVEKGCVVCVRRDRVFQKGICIVEHIFMLRRAVGCRN